MDFKKTARKYVEKQGHVKCCVCGQELYYYDKFECAKGKKGYTFIHKDCLKLRGEQDGTV